MRKKVHSNITKFDKNEEKALLKTIAVSLSLNRQIMNCQLLRNEKKSVIAVLNAFQDPIIKYI